MIKTQFLKAVMLGLCLSTLYTGVAYADTIDGKAAEVTTQDTGSGSEVLNLQGEIDQYVFTDHFDELQKKGITVTQTTPMDNYVEIGIAPFNDENANYLYDIFGKDKVKVVKGEEMKVYKTNEAAAPDTAVASEVVKNSLVTRQEEVNKVLFEDNSSELESKGIAIMHTTPLEGYIEVGILPYNEENVKFIYSLTGEDKVKVVEGKEPELMATSGIATDDVKTTAVEDNAETVSTTGAGNGNVDKTAAASNNLLPIAGVAGAAVLIGGAAIYSRKKKTIR